MNKKHGSSPEIPIEQTASALVITGETEEDEIFGSTMAGLGQCLAAVRHPLEAIRCLQDSTLSIRVVFAPANELVFQTSEFFAFMKEAFPLVRRISYSDHGPINRVQGSSPNAEQES